MWQIKRQILRQDCLVERHQLGTGIEAQLIGKHGPKLFVAVERLALPTSAV
jgi:hypothetical protein